MITKYHFRYNEQKKFMELENVNFQLAVDAGKINKMFSGLNWITTHFSQNPEQEIKNLIYPLLIILTSKAVVTIALLA